VAEGKVTSDITLSAGPPWNSNGVVLPDGRLPALRNAWRAAQPNAYHRQSLAAEAAAPRAASRR